MTHRLKQLTKDLDALETALNTARHDFIMFGERDADRYALEQAEDRLSAWLHRNIEEMCDLRCEAAAV